MKKPTEYIKEAIDIYKQKENFVFFAKIMAVLALVSVPLSYSISYFFPKEKVESFVNNGFTPLEIWSYVLYVFLIIASGLASLWLNSTLYSAVVDRDKKDVKLVFTNGYKKMWKYFLLSSLIGVITLLGLILLVVPGIILSVWFANAIYVLYSKNLGVIKSLKESKKLVTGRFWEFAYRGLVVGLFGSILTWLVSIVPFVGPIFSYFVMPLTTLAYYLIYRDLDRS